MNNSNLMEASNSTFYSSEYFILNIENILFAAVGVT